MNPSTSTPIIDVDGAADQVDQPVSATTSTAADDQLLQIVQQLSTQQHDYGQMMVICCGLIIGILLCSLIRWWR